MSPCFHISVVQTIKSTPAASAAAPSRMPIDEFIVPDDESSDDDSSEPYDDDAESDDGGDSTGDSDDSEEVFTDDSGIVFILFVIFSYRSLFGNYYS